MTGRLPLRPRRRVPLWVTVLLTAAGAWIVGLLAFVDTARAPPADPGRPTDAVVVLTGGSERVATGFRLLTEGVSDRLFISGVFEDTRLSDLLATAGLTDDSVSPDTVTLGRVARDTRGNAREVAAWVAANRIGSVRLVTANYHMPRALLELRTTLPSLAIVPHPVTPGMVRLEAWWRWPGTASLIVTEYTKYLVALARGLGDAG